MTGPQTTPEHAERQRLRVGPLVVVVAVVAGLALWLVPGLAGEVRTSVTRHEEPYLALSFDDEAAARRCAVEDGVLDLDIRAANHLDDDLELSWVARVVPRSDDGEPSSATAGEADSGVAEVPSGRSTVVRATVKAPASGTYDVSVTLAGRSEHLSLVCGGDA